MNKKITNTLCSLVLVLSGGCATVGNAISGAVVSPINTFQKAREAANNGKNDDLGRKIIIYAMMPIIVPASIPAGLIIGARDGAEADVYAFRNRGVYQQGKAPFQCSYYLQVWEND